MTLAGLSAPAGGAAGGGVGRILLVELDRLLHGTIGWSSPLLLGILAMIPAFLLLMSALGVPVRSLKPALSGSLSGSLPGLGGIGGAVSGLFGAVAGLAGRGARGAAGLKAAVAARPEAPARAAGGLSRRAPSLGGEEAAARPERAEPSLS
ncbi:MAG TPA: hypothetical protein VEB20_06360, partial [Azospirillaceae bacterium]|nr:hypothetical protein [Azospirillaceae bacterium]